MIRKVLDTDEAPDMWKIESNTDLLLVNSYEALGNVRPSGPTTVFLGGIHKKNKKTSQLSASLRQFLDDSEKVVYVNLNYGIHQYSSRLEKLMKALEEAKVDIVWNWGNGDLVNSTTRIYQGSDLDQEDLLGELHLLFN